MNLTNINISLFNDNIHDESLDIQSCWIHLVQNNTYVINKHKNWNILLLKEAIKRKEVDLKFWSKSTNKIIVVLNVIFNRCYCFIKLHNFIEKSHQLKSLWSTWYENYLYLVFTICCCKMIRIVIINFFQV